jgi:hypothetical protein
MPEPKHISVEEAQDEGVYGTLHDTIDNEAYTVSGQGPETAKREREQLHELRHGQRLASRHEDDASSTQGRSSRSKSPSSSSKSSESSSSGGSAS